MEHKSFNTPLITHNTPTHHTPPANALAHIVMAVEMRVQGRGVTNTCGLGPGNTEPD